MCFQPNGFWREIWTSMLGQHQNMMIAVWYICPICASGQYGMLFISPLVQQTAVHSLSALEWFSILSIDLEWLTPGDCNDHHSVMPCAPDKLPEYSMEEHDSFRAFRSQNFNMSWSFETQPCEDGDAPCCNFYASTLRWMDKMKVYTPSLLSCYSIGRIHESLYAPSV